MVRFLLSTYTTVGGLFLQNSACGCFWQCPRQCTIFKSTILMKENISITLSRYRMNYFTNFSLISAKGCGLLESSFDSNVGSSRS